MNEIKKTKQDMKEEINKDTETLKNNHFEVNSSTSQFKTATESSDNRVNQVVNGVSRTEGKVEELDQTVKDDEKILRKYEWNMQDFWNTMKRQIYKSWV
jgi:hypothetical protein